MSMIQLKVLKITEKDGITPKAQVDGSLDYQKLIGLNVEAYAGVVGNEFIFFPNREVDYFVRTSRIEEIKINLSKSLYTVKTKYTIYFFEIIELNKSGE